MNQTTMNPLRAARLRDVPVEKQRERQPYTQSYRQVSERLGLHMRQLERWEAGDTIPSIKSAETLAKHFGFENAQALRLALRQWQEQHRPDRKRFYQHKELLQTA